MKHKLYFILILVLVSVFSVNGNIASASRVQAANKTYEPPAGSKEAKYISGLDLSKEKGTYYTTKKEEYIETTRYVLYLGKGVEVPVNVIELINYIMDMVEKETGYKFYAKSQGEYIIGMNYELDTYFTNATQLKKVDPKHSKISIVAINDDNFDGAYASGGDGALLSAEYIKLLDGKADGLIHELLHVAMLRNGRSMNGVFNEGFATFYTSRIIEKDKKLNCTFDTYTDSSDYRFPINEDTMEQLYIIQDQGSGRYQLGFRLMSYIYEKYGNKAYKKLHEKVDSLLGENDYQASTELIARVIKKQISKDFFVDFAKWHKLNREKFGDQDISALGEWVIEYGTLTRYYGNDTHVVIPDYVTSIGYEAFIYCTSMETIKVPDTVTSIGGGTFYKCVNLKEITIPNSVTRVYQLAFSGCSSLEKVVLSNKLTEIPDCTFDGCSSLKNITLPKGIKRLGDNAFSDCTALSKITLPKELEEIGNNAFSGCAKLKSINIPSGVNKMLANVFSDCTGLKDVVLPKDLNRIENGLFWGCKSLKTIKIPDGVKEIGDSAFNFTSLSEVKIPNGVTSIGDFAFGQCKNIKIEIPESVKSIEKDTFYGCDKLIIYGKKGSYAEKYAKQNSLKFVVK